MEELIPIERIENKIYLIRGQKVIIDRDLAELYGVRTKELNKAVSRNQLRFPPDFMFRLTKEEYSALRFQFGTLEKGKHSKYLPHVFTEQGIAMLSSVLNSDRAVLINIAIMRAFVRLRLILSSHKVLARKVKELEKKYSKHEIEITTVFKLLKRLMEPPIKPKSKIGFIVEKQNKGGNRHA